MSGFSVCGAAGVVPGVCGAGGTDGEGGLSASPRSRGHRHTTSRVVVDHTGVVVPENVLWWNWALTEDAFNIQDSYISGYIIFIYSFY